MLWHFQNKPFLSRNVDMYVFPPQILGTNENVCHVSFILETPKLHGLGLSFFSLDILGVFFGLIQFLLKELLLQKQQKRDV